MALKVIGAGFGRTGTHSLKLALETLGFGPCHHMFELRDDPAQVRAWDEVARGASPDWEALFAGYRSQVDWPGALYWRQLAARYPNAKVILTVRDPDDWFDSVQRTIWPFMRDRAAHDTPNKRAIGELTYRLVAEGIFGGRMDDRAHATSVFRDHIEEVKRTIPATWLLVYDVAEGWRPLARFLEVATPKAPFPHSNSSRDFAGGGAKH